MATFTTSDQKLLASGIRTVAHETDGAPDYTKGLSHSMSSSLLIRLAKAILSETEKLDAYLQETGGKGSSFDANAPLNFPHLPEDIQEARQKVIESTRRFGCRAHREYSMDGLGSKPFPPNTSATYTAIAERVGLSEINVRGFMRHAMTNRIFREVSPGVVEHTARSRVLAEDAATQDWVCFCVDDMWPAASKTVEAIVANPIASSALQCGFCTANNTTDKEPMFVTIGRSLAWAKRFSGAMEPLTGGRGDELSYLLDDYDWDAIDNISGTVVDVGGSHGFVCVELAKRWKNMRFVVPWMIANAPKHEGDIGERIAFQAHDFLTEQPVEGADVYLFRWIIRGRSDTYAIPMLHSLTPALKTSAKIVVNDHCLPESSGQESQWNKKIFRTMDLVMLTLLNAQERSAEEFEDLFLRADKRFGFKGVVRPKGCRIGILEAVWKGEDFGGGGYGSATVDDKEMTK